jgi:hypothetical protein
MSDTKPNTPETTDEPTPEKEPEHPGGFTFTDGGCRTELRLGALLTLMGVFFWQFSLPWAQRFLLIGLPLVLIGVPWQAFDARRYGRPGYPWKLAIALTVIGLALLSDQFYRTSITSPTQLMWPWVPSLIFAGIWMLVWWPVARPPARPEPMIDGGDRD